MYEYTQEPDVSDEWQEEEKMCKRQEIGLTLNIFGGTPS